MKKAKCTIEDLIDDKIEMLEDILTWWANHKELPDAPPLWEGQSFQTWSEFRMSREKWFIENESEPNEDFPMALFDIADPSAIRIIKDDCDDLLKILKDKKLLTRRADYVRSVFYAADITNARAHFIIGYLNSKLASKYRRETMRLILSTNKKRENRLKDKEEVLQVITKKFGNIDLKLVSKNKIANFMLKDLGIGKMSLNKLRGLLEELNKEGLITLSASPKVTKM